MSNYEFTVKRKLAIAKLEQLMYDFYVKTDNKRSYEIWQWLKQINTTSRTKLTKKELESLHDLWDQYVKYIKEEDGR
tara:strand:+ start:572 stop:802 length:231 start_codon:yes stop_codon:yes gene_type:complete